MLQILFAWGCAVPDYIRTTSMFTYFPTSFLLFNVSSSPNSPIPPTLTPDADVEQNEWQVQPDGSRLRDLSYTVALNYSFGPKFTHTTEHQIYSKTGQPGLKHIVDTEVGRIVGYI